METDTHMPNFPWRIRNGIRARRSMLRMSPLNSQSRSPPSPPARAHGLMSSITAPPGPPSLILSRISWLRRAALRSTGGDVSQSAAHRRGRSRSRGADEHQPQEQGRGGGGGAVTNQTTATIGKGAPEALELRVEDSAVLLVALLPIVRLEHPPLHAHALLGRVRSRLLGRDLEAV